MRNTFLEKSYTLDEVVHLLRTHQIYLDSAGECLSTYSEDHVAAARFAPLIRRYRDELITHEAEWEAWGLVSPHLLRLKQRDKERARKAAQAAEVVALQYRTELRDDGGNVHGFLAEVSRCSAVEWERNDRGYFVLQGDQVAVSYFKRGFTRFFDEIQEILGGQDA
jgi:hypothetical protein